MNKYGVFGNPIQHSISPQIHQKFADQFKIKLSYEKILADNFKDSANKFINCGANGFNITTPFKTEAFDFADELSSSAQLSGSVNTIKIIDKQLFGYNTDGEGLIHDLIDNLKLDLTDKTILVLGAGGASRGIIPALLQYNPNRVMIANRTAIKAKELAQKFSHLGKTCGFGLDKIKKDPVDIIINATSIGLGGDMPDICGEICNNAICYELMYGKQTKFMHWAKANNAKQVVDGTGMLVEQAAIAFYIWTGKIPKTSSIIESLKQ